MENINRRQALKVIGAATAGLAATQQISAAQAQKVAQAVWSEYVACSSSTVTCWDALGVRYSFC